VAMRVLSAHKSPVLSLAYSADGRLLASGDERGMLYLWDLADGRPRGSMAFPPLPILGLAFDPGGGRLAVCQPQAVSVWTVALRGFDLYFCPLGGSCSLLFRGPGHVAVTGYLEDSVVEFDLGQGRETHRYQNYAEGLLALATDRAGQRLAGGGGLG